jgi:hypothetical protein
MGIKTKVKHALRNRRATPARRREPGKWEFPDSDGYGDGGVREPRRPKGGPPADTISLPEPR